MKKKCKIAFIVRDINNGGVSKMVNYYANIAYEVFEEVHIVAIGKKTDVGFIDNGKIQLDIIGRTGARTNKIFAVINDISKLRTVINEIKPDVLFPFASGNVIYTYLSVLRRYYIVGAERGNPEELKSVLKLLCRYIYKRMDFMFFQSQGAADYYGIPKDKCAIIPNPCIIPRKYAGSRHIKKRSGKIILLSMSRLAKEKNTDVIIKAVSRCLSKDKIELVIFGDGPMKNELENLANQLNVSTFVSFKGNTNDPLIQIINSDIFILVSSGEGMPNALIEAMSMGVPCITTKCMVNDTNSLVDDGVNGLIVKKGDVQSLSEAIDKLVCDESFYENISNASIKVREELSEPRINKMIRKEFENIKSKAILREKNGV